MKITVTCSDHPTYKGVHAPRATTRNPSGCEQCWWLYSHRTSQNVEVVGQFKHSRPVMKVVRG
jgi:hypothetical protein